MLAGLSQSAQWGLLKAGHHSWVVREAALGSESVSVSAHELGSEAGLETEADAESALEGGFGVGLSGSQLAVWKGRSLAGRAVRQPVALRGALAGWQMGQRAVLQPVVLQGPFAGQERELRAAWDRGEALPAAVSEPAQL